MLLFSLYSREAIVSPTKQSARKIPGTPSVGIGTELLTQSSQSLEELIKHSVSEALEAAKAQWLSQFERRNGGEDLNNLISRVDILTDRIQGLDAQSFSYADKKHTEELFRIAHNIEGRLSRLEAKLEKIELGQTKAAHESHSSALADKMYLEDRFASLVERMSIIEASVEAEHESSIDLIDLLLKKRSKSNDR
jgi:hypothetical protein